MDKEHSMEIFSLLFC